MLCIDYYKVNFCESEVRSTFKKVRGFTSVLLRCHSLMSFISSKFCLSPQSKTTCIKFITHGILSSTYESLLNLIATLFLVHLSRRLKCTIVITHCPSSVRPSVRRPSVVNFSHFRLLLWHHWTELNETWQEGRSQHPLPSLCFSGRSEKQDGRPDLWLAETFSTSPLKPLNGIQRNLTGSKISTSST